MTYLCPISLSRYLFKPPAWRPQGPSPPHPSSLATTIHGLRDPQRRIVVAGLAPAMLPAGGVGPCGRSLGHTITQMASVSPYWQRYLNCIAPCGGPVWVTGMSCGRPDWQRPADTTYLRRQLAFHDQRYALTSANTQRCQAVVRLTTLHFVKQRNQYTCAACPNWMTQGNRTTVYVELGPVEP